MTRKLGGLTALTLRVGPSGGGKSTVLDARLIGASGAPGAAIGIAVTRHADSLQGAGWLFAPRRKSASIVCVDDSMRTLATTLEWLDEPDPDLVAT